MQCEGIGVLMPAHLLQINALDDVPESISGLCSVTGSEFSRLAPTEQSSAVARLNVFARVEPSHKSNLVTRLKEQARLCLSVQTWRTLGAPDFY